MSAWCNGIGLDCDNSVVVKEPGASWCIDTGWKMMCGGWNTRWRRSESGWLPWQWGGRSTGSGRWAA